jgi:EAL domain-containing protein (putative c-di-GMP-specific phosphodiesterase class I)
MMTFACTHCQSPHSGEIAIDIAFQPIFDCSSQRVRAYEALVRGPQGESAASVLAGVVEENLHRFEQRVRVLAIEKAAALGIVASGAALSINSHPRAPLESERCLDHTIAAAAAVGLPHRAVVFEFTERARLDAAKARAVIATYAKHGFRTALDDFGDGYAGLVTLADVPTEFVKLDMGLIRGIDGSRERQAIVAGLVGILKALGRRVAAEGIETAGELATVRALGVEMVQGFYLGRPSRTELQREPYRVAVPA